MDEPMGEGEGGEERKTESARQDVSVLTESMSVCFLSSY
jgi:hypothetical protein